MELYLMQHGLALEKDVDPERHLSPEGKTQIERSAQVIKKMGIRLDAIVTSPKERSKETGALVAEALKLPVEKVLETEMVKAKASPQDSLRFLEPYGDQSILIAGHLPSLSNIASLLLSKGANVAIQFENGGILKIDVESLEEPSGTLRWYLPSSILHFVCEV